MNTLFAVIALPPTTNTSDLAQLMLHNSLEASRANAAYVSGQVTQLKHRIDRAETEFQCLGYVFVILAVMSLILFRSHRSLARRVTKLEGIPPKSPR